ncbi:response regulator transcription factor [Peptacetobacter sp.]|uniref:response regulator transcription factor n=1 Tax=Peptacetobacter sp. TaxID=2991975 RepID=UPI002611CC8A|nr:response regulator [Peptacetobacter sp.]
MYLEKYKSNYLEKEEYKVLLDENNIDIFIIGCDIFLAEEIKRNLEKYGYTSEIANNFKKIIDEVFILNPKLIIIDFDLSDKNMSTLYKDIKEYFEIPIIFLIDQRIDIDILKNIINENEYYILKPFSIDSLIKKVQLIFKTIYSCNSINNDIFEFGDIILNFSNNTIEKNGKKMLLNYDEMEIIKIIVSNINNIVSKKYIVDAFSKNIKNINEVTIDLIIDKLTNKLELIGIYNFINKVENYGFIVNSKINEL